MYDAWGNHDVFGLNKVNGIEVLQDIYIKKAPAFADEYLKFKQLGEFNPFRYRGYYYDIETGLYYLQTRYYDPEVGRFISQDSIEYADPETINGLNLYAYCGNNPVMGYDPDGTWDWGKFWAGLGLIVTAIAAVVVSVATFGAGTPLAMTMVAGVTLAAGILTGVNGIATIIEAGTNYNFVRDGIFQGNETVYNWYAGITEGVAVLGTAVLGAYQSTGRYKASKVGRDFVGKGYKSAGKNRWISKDGLRQVRFDGSHFNLEVMAQQINSGVRNITLLNWHVYFNGLTITKFVLGGKGWFLF